ncbi:MAG: MMPL family transporter, partial [Pseudomonadota bacterium]
MAHANTKTANLFRIVTSRPRLVVLLAVVVIVFTGAGLTRLVKDTSVKAFIPPGHSSLAADEKAEALFGLSDTIAVALITQDGRNVFSPDILTVIDKLTLDISALANVRSDKMTSLATESSIRANDGGVVVESYIDPTRIDTARAADAFDRWQRMYPHQNTLVSADASGAIIMAELANADAADETYLAVLALTESISIAGVDIHVAGPGAVSGYLSRYIDEDARKLQPLVFLVVLGFIYLAFRRLAALPGPLMVVVGSAAGALGLMAWLGIPYYAITNALPVIIVAISVADAIHILSAYYQHREQEPELSRRELVILALSSMARPISLTTLTTIAGFAGIAMMSVMPPITWFAIFAAVGVLFAWAFSILVLPNVLLLIDPGRSPAFVSWQQGRAGGTGRWLAWLATRSQRHVFGVLTAFVLISTAAGYSATHLRIDRSQVENFASDEPIRIADEVTNATFAGTAFLDIIVQSDTPGGLLTVAAANRIRDLQTHFESLAHVEKTVSIVDYLSQLHVALDGLPPTTARARHLPGQDNVIAETLFVYEITGDPADLAEEIDADYQHALVRGVLDAHYYSETRTVVESLQRYIDQSFNGDGLTATLTGDVNVNYHWMSSLQTSHFKGVGLSLILVLLASILVFRSFTAGIVSVVPVAFTVLAIYACMGYLGIYLEPATSMFAAIALGVGVDFAIHLVDRLRKAIANNGDDPQAAVRAALPPVARACFFNSAALGLG